LKLEDINVPDLGDSSEVEVIELLVAVGDLVEENDSLIVLESDKAAMEIPAPVGGKVNKIAVNLGDQVSTGSLILSIEVDGDSCVVEKETNLEVDDATLDAGKNDLLPTEDSKKSKAGNDSVLPEVKKTTRLIIPDLGSSEEVEVIELHVSVGDTVQVDDPLITVETDKAAMEVPATINGKITELLVTVGKKVTSGFDIGSIISDDVAEDLEESKDYSDTETRPKKESKSGTNFLSASVPPEMIAPQILVSENGRQVYAGPAVRKLARELGVNLSQVEGTGVKKRIVKSDVQNFVKLVLNSGPSNVIKSSIPDIDFTEFGEIEQVSRTKLSKLTAENMARNWNSVPAVAQFIEADITDLEEFRLGLKKESEKKGVKLTLLPFLLKATALGLAKYPQFNVSLHSSDEYLIQKKYIHIGIAVATDHGLVVPVIRNVDRKSIWELAEEAADLSAKAKNRKLGKAEIQGACFTISSLGAIGGTGFIPIVNSPEVAILGVARSAIKPVFKDSEFLPRKMLPLTLTYDHRAVNGVDGGLFATYLSQLLEDIRYLSM
jgi:pyruvate dehydrogenase E2 component (dihydrolipoamide acetyltransferase)